MLVGRGLGSCRFQGSKSRNPYQGGGIEDQAEGGEGTSPVEISRKRAREAKYFQRQGDGKKLR